ncbi:MAG: DUF4386 domain-containing protein [Gemmatimonadetes bacterium]|nr:DUF4386 domain-containing protein [Gemmatimonadota bacterium]
MPPVAITPLQQRAARVVGWAYLLALPLSVFGVGVMGTRIVDVQSAATTAAQLLANEPLFRLAVTSDLAAFVVDVALVTGLFLVLEPVDRLLALGAAILRIVETALFLVVTLKYLDAISLLGPAAYLTAIPVDQLRALARLAFTQHAVGYSVGLILAGLGSTLFAILWVRSGYIPRALAIWGIVSSLALAAGTLALLLMPGLSGTLTVAIYGPPIFLFELGMGLVLLMRRLGPSPVAPAS